MGAFGLSRLAKVRFACGAGKVSAHEVEVAEASHASQSQSQERRYAQDCHPPW